MDFAYQGTLYLLGVSLTFIVSFILFRSAAGNPRINRLLGVAFFCMAWYNMIYYLTVTNQIPRFYWILGWGTPLYYLITPCIFLYVRQTLNGVQGLTRKDWVHFLPFIIVLLDHLPFCLGLYGSKMAFARASSTNHNQFYLHHVALIPSITHFICRPVQALIYLFFQWKLLIQAYPKRKENGKVYRWMILLTSMVTTFYVVLSVLTFTGILSGKGLYVVLNYKYLILMLDICLLVISMGLLFYPEALYGIPNLKAMADRQTMSALQTISAHQSEDLALSAPTAPEPWGPLVYPPTVHGQISLVRSEAIPPPEAGSAEGHESPEDFPETFVNTFSPPISPYLLPKPSRENKIPKDGDLHALIQTLEKYLQAEKPYLLSKWSIQEMAVATHIPLHQLSFVINHHYKVRYTELMNRYRVNHAKELIAAGAWKELSLEGLAKQSGFANRTNFFLVFKKFTGLSPSEYLQQVKTAG
jgi:AraC-like DNA-binding protein